MDIQLLGIDEREALADVYAVIREAAGRRPALEAEANQMAHIWLNGVEA